MEAGRSRHLSYLTMRREQLQALTSAAAARFEERAVAHVRRHFQAQAAALGEPELRAAAAHAAARAASHGFDSDDEVMVYLTLMFCFGRDFDLDPGCAWAREALADRAGGNAARLARLRTLGLAYEEEGRGYRPRVPVRG